MARKPTLKLMIDKAQGELTAEQRKIARAAIADMPQASLEFIRDTMETARRSGKNPRLDAVMLKGGDGNYPAVMISGGGFSQYYFPGKSYPVPMLGTTGRMLGGYTTGAQVVLGEARPASRKSMGN